MAQKSILEQALLQVQTLEEAVKANAKGILASTMKQELNDLLKEQEDEKFPDEEEKDVEGLEPEDDETSITDDKPAEDEAPEDAEEFPSDEEIPSEGGDELPAMSDEGGEEDFLDMTGASEAEVLKVFKAMKPEDGIVVKKDGNTVQFSDDGNDYIIKLDDEAGEGPEHEAGETPEEEDMEHSGENPEEMPDEMSDESDEMSDETDELNEANEPADGQELVYEIELDDEDESNPIEATEGENSPFDKKRTETKEGVTVTKSVTTKDGQPFTKSSPQKGVKKLETNVTSHKVSANEQESGVDKWSGTPLKGTSKPKTDNLGKGKNKTSNGDWDGTAVKGTSKPKADNLGKGGSKTSQFEKFQGTPVKGTSKPVVKEPKEEVECKECGNNKVEAKESSRTGAFGYRPDDHGQSKKALKAGNKRDEYLGKKSVNEEVEILKKQNGEYRKALVLFKDKLNEVAVFNANLAYATRLFTEHSTTKQEKLNILQRFDSISTITESKNLYSTIKGELDTKKPISESAVEKIASTPSSSSTEMLSESKAYENPQFRRMKELMSKIK